MADFGLQVSFKMMLNKSYRALIGLLGILMPRHNKNKTKSLTETVN